MVTKEDFILITGASGFIGQHLLRHYLEEGAHVVAFVPDPENMGEFQKYPNFDNKLYGDPVYNEVRRKKP